MAKLPECHPLAPIFKWVQELYLAVVRMPPQSSLCRMKVPKSLTFSPSAVLWGTHHSFLLLDSLLNSIHPVRVTSFGILDKGTILLWWTILQSQLQLTWCFKKQNSNSPCGYLIASMFYVMNNISHLQSKISRQMPFFLPSRGRGRVYEDVVSIKTDVLFKCCKLNKE